ncbi:MAG: metal ABC transporter permease [Gemmataceae bacterium]
MLTGLLADASGHWLDGLFLRLAGAAPSGSFFSYSYNLYALVALVLVSLSCGAVGSLVVGGRMAFFSDALAHCAFASVSIGFVLFTWFISRFRPAAEFWTWVTPIMLGFGLGIGYLIAYVRERTGLASDTVIGVAFAAAIGLAAMLREVMQSRDLFRLEDFLFGNPLLLRGDDLVALALLTVVTVALLALTFNHLLLSSFNTSLALSRRVPTRLVSYAFIMLLALVVNLSVRTVGVLLINALLVVPAATAANLSRNLRQVFWLTMGLCLASSLLGQAAAWECENRFDLRLGIPGTVILVSVTAFIASAVVGPRLRERRAAS